MKKIIVFGGGYRGRDIIKKIEKISGGVIIAVADNYLTGKVDGKTIIKPENIGDYDYDCICLATQKVDEAISQLLELGVDFYAINTNFLINSGIGAREMFLNHISNEIYRRGIQGSVAEAGVLRGDFASHINLAFPDRKLFLFDTFEGFDSRDFEMEKEQAQEPINNIYISSTSEAIVMQKMRNPKNVNLIKGYVPESLQGIDERFCFVNLDMDLYKPTKEALKWFFPRMEYGGGILVHDFYNDKAYPNLKYAVMEFCKENGNLNYFPIGDEMSVFIPKC